MSYINLNLTNPRIEFFSSSKISSPVIPELAPRNFWKVSHIANQELTSVAQTGDIVLFSGKNMQSNILKGLMGSKYDHVGMLVRYPKSGQLVLFESLQGKGVCRWDWNNLTAKGSEYWQKSYSKVVYRRLLGVERDENFINTLQNFMQQTAGMPYRLTVGSIVQAEQHERIEGSIRKEIKLVNNGFFCSELIALALKRLGLIDGSIAPNKYWPGNFSTEDPASEI